MSSKEQCGPLPELGGAPVAPPIAEEVRPEGMPVSPPIIGESDPTIDEEQKQPGLLRRNIGKIAAGTAVVVALGLIGNSCSEKDNATPADKSNTPASPANSGPSEEACPNGTFSKENPFLAEEDVKPGQLYRSPTHELKNKSELYNYFMGNKAQEIDGELCMLPGGLAVQEIIMNGWVGEGSAGARPFNNPIQDANELRRFYASNPNEAKDTLDDNKFQAFIDSYQLNQEAIKAGAYYKIMLQDGKIVQQAVDLADMAPGDVFVLEGDIWFGDSKFSSSQVALVDKNGNQYILKSIGGAEIIAPDTTTTTAPAAPLEGTAGNTGGNGGGSGGNTGGNGGGSGGNTGGNGGGGNGSGGNGGGSGGGGNGGGSGGGGEGGGDNPTTTTTTIRPTTTTTTTTIRPTTTTTQPKGTEITIPGAPN